jgi:hypothetical protein
MSEDPCAEIVIAEIERNSRDVLRVVLGSYERTATIAVWSWYRAASGELRPSKRGIIVGIRHLPALAEALGAALAAARANGRLPLA